jgi:2-phosphoglycolate phosphatase
MHRQLDLLMFDLDGTLADTSQDITDAVNHMRLTLGLEVLTAPAVLEHLGLGLEFLIRGVLPQSHQHLARRASNLFLAHYSHHLLDNTVLYPHVIEMLDHYGDKKKAVVSNKPLAPTIALLRGLHIGKRFDIVLGGDTTAGKKPDPEPLNYVLASLAVSPRKALMVGDDRPDIQAGKNAGVYTCAVTYGLGNKTNLLQTTPDTVIDDILELKYYYS